MLTIAYDGILIVIPYLDLAIIGGLIWFALLITITRRTLTGTRRKRRERERAAVTLHIARNGKRFYP